MGGDGIDHAVVLVAVDAVELARPDMTISSVPFPLPHRATAGSGQIREEADQYRIARHLGHGQMKGIIGLFAPAPVLRRPPRRHLGPQIVDVGGAGVAGCLGGDLRCRGGLCRCTAKPHDRQNRLAAPFRHRDRRDHDGTVLPALTAKITIMPNACGPASGRRGVYSGSPA